MDDLPLGCDRESMPRCGARQPPQNGVESLRPRRPPALPLPGGGWWGCAPAREELEGLGSAAAHVGGEDREPEPVSGKRHDLVVELEFADDGVPEALASGLVVADVVRGPPVRKLSLRVESSPTRSLRARSYGSRPASDRRWATRSFARAFPIDEEVLGDRVEKREAGAVGRLFSALEERRVECPAEGVGGEVVPPAVADCRRARSSRRGSAARPVGRVAVRRAAGGAARRVGGAGEIEQVGPFGVVELSAWVERIEDGVGDAAGVAAFEALVVLEADARERWRPPRV